MACPTANHESVRVRGNIFWHNSDLDSDSDGTSAEEPEDESPEAEEQSSEEEEGGENTMNTKTDAKYWKCMKNGRGGRNVGPIPYTGNEEFAVNITDEEVEQLKDENGDIRFHKVMEWCIPKFDGESYWEWLAA